MAPYLLRKGNPYHSSREKGASLMSAVSRTEREFAKNAGVIYLNQSRIDTDLLGQAQEFIRAHGRGSEAVLANNDPVAGLLVINLAKKPGPGLDLEPLEPILPDLAGVR